VLGLTAFGSLTWHDRRKLSALPLIGYRAMTARRPYPIQSRKPGQDHMAMEISVSRHCITFPQTPLPNWSLFNRRKRQNQP